MDEKIQGKWKWIISDKAAAAAAAAAAGGKSKAKIIQVSKNSIWDRLYWGFDCLRLKFQFFGTGIKKINELFFG